MIVVSIDMWPLGNESAQYPLGRMYIVNQESTSTRNPNRGDYLAAVCRRGSRDLPQPIDPDGPQSTRAGVISDYPRLSYNVWRLISRAMHVTFPEETNQKTKPVIAAEVLAGLRSMKDVALSQHLLCSADVTTQIKLAIDWLHAADELTDAG